jgi:hypothetical protein
MRPGKEYSFRLQGRGGPIQMCAVAQWSQLVRTDSTEGDVIPVYQIGLHFQEILDERALEILHFLEENIIIDVDQRLFGRFSLRDPQSVELDVSSEFQMRRISLSGILVEAELSVPLERDLIVELDVQEPKLSLRARGRVAFVAGGPENGRGHSQLGIEFLDLSPENKHRLEAFLRGLLE